MEAPEWTEEDRAALLGLQRYEETLCPGCGHPKQVAWHSNMTGWWKSDLFVCLACTASAGSTPDGKPNERIYGRTYPDPAVTDIDDLPPLQLGQNTVPPTQ